MEKAVVILKVMGIVVPVIGYALLARKLFRIFNRKSCEWLLVGSLLVNIIYGMQLFLFASLSAAPFYTALLISAFLVSVAFSATWAHNFLRNEF